MIEEYCHRKLAPSHIFLCFNGQSLGNHLWWLGSFKNKQSWKINRPEQSHLSFCYTGTNCQNELYCQKWSELATHHPSFQAWEQMLPDQHHLPRSEGSTTTKFLKLPISRLTLSSHNSRITWFIPSHTTSLKMLCKFPLLFWKATWRKFNKNSLRQQLK